MFARKQRQNGVVHAEITHGFGERVPCLEVVIGVQSYHHHFVLVNSLFDVLREILNGFGNGICEDILASPVVEVLSVD